MSYDQQSGGGQWTPNPDGTWLTPDGKTAWQNADGSWQTTDGWYLGASGQWQYIGGTVDSSAQETSQQGYAQSDYAQQGFYQQEYNQQEFEQQGVSQQESNQQSFDQSMAVQQDSGQMQTDQSSEVSEQVPAVEESVANEPVITIPEVERTMEVKVPPPSDEVVSGNNIVEADKTSQSETSDSTVDTAEEAPGEPVMAEPDKNPDGIQFEEQLESAEPVVPVEPLQTEPVVPAEPDTVVYQQVYSQPEQEPTAQDGIGASEFTDSEAGPYSAADLQSTRVIPVASTGPDYYQASAASAAGPAAASANAYSQPMSEAYTPQGLNPYDAFDPYGGNNDYNDEEEKAGKGGIIAIVLLIVTLLLLIAAGVYLYFWVLNDDSSQADGKQIAKEQPVDKEKKNKTDKDDKEKRDQKGDKDQKEQKKPISNENPDVKYPAPSDAMSLRNFVMPSGNIECQFASTEVGCAIIERDYEAKGLKDCKGKVVFNLRLDQSGTEIVCDFDYRDGGSELPYGKTTAFGEHACESTESGVRCWNVYSGKEFTMAREAWSAN